MWGIKGNKTNAQHQSNKARGGNIKGSTIEVNGGDATQAVILKAVMDLTDKVNKIDTRLDTIEVNQSHTYLRTKKISKGLNHYVKNNGVSPKVKREVEEMLDLKEVK